MVEPQARYFRPNERGEVPWHQPLRDDLFYNWDVAQKSGISQLVATDAGTTLILEAVEEALELFHNADPAASLRAGTFIELLATSIEARGGQELSFAFELAAVGRHFAVPARPVCP